MKILELTLRDDKKIHINFNLVESFQDYPDGGTSIFFKSSNAVVKETPEEINISLHRGN